MCGRYYIDDETVNEIEKIVRKVSEKFSKKGEIYPTNKVPIIHGEDDALVASAMTWGFPQYTGKGVIFNARGETAMTKRTFSESILKRRCIVPAAGFFEWDKEKNKVRFERSDSNVLYMAGIWNIYKDENRFVILTVGANSSVENVHDRMPLILESNELENWTFDNNFIDYVLHKTPAGLKQFREFEQAKLPL